MIILPQAYACDDWRTRFAATNEYIISIISKHFAKHKISSRRASNERPYRIDTEKHGLFIFRTSVFHIKIFKLLFFQNTVAVGAEEH